jgi:hypothetical protein
MSLVRTALRSATVVAVATPLSLLAATAAQAGQITEELSCDGHSLVVRVSENSSGEQGGWGSVKVVEGGSGHLTPLEFRGTGYDVTIGQEVFQFSAPKGGGHPATSGSTTCTATYTGTLADLVDEGEELPPGAALTDEITFTFTVVVVQRGA